MSANPSDKSSDPSEAVRTDEAQHSGQQESDKPADSSGNAPTSSEVNANSMHSAEAPARAFDDLSLSELVERFMRSPARTWRRLQFAAKAPVGIQQSIASNTDAAVASMRGSARSRTSGVKPRRYFGLLLQENYIRLMVYALAFIFAFMGSAIARGTEDIPRTGEFSLQVGAPFLWLGFLLWLSGDIVRHLPQIKSYWRNCDRWRRAHWLARVIPALIMLGSLYLLAQAMAAPRDQATLMANAAFRYFIVGAIVLIIVEVVGRRARLFAQPLLKADQSERQNSEQVWIATRSPRYRSILREMSSWRKFVLVAAILCSAYVWANTSGNRIETQTIMIWLLSVALWSLVFAPLRWNIFDWASGRVDAWRRINLHRNRWLLLALAVIMLHGFNLRFSALESSPPQLISDHVENIRDAFNIRYNNYSPILFTNYNSREPLHYYLAVALSSLPGLEVDQYTFSLLSAIQGLITLPLLFWLALEVMGERQRRFGRVYALIVASLAAISFWHITLSRQGFRVALCPLFVAFSLVFYVRALRNNRRSDFVKAGLLLGFGLLSYQSVQLLPAVFVLGVAVTLLARPLSRRIRLRYVQNLGVLMFVALIVFLPMLHVWAEEPDAALIRHTTSIFGDARFTAAQRQDFLRENGVTLLSNLRSIALMFHYNGDNVWIAGFPDEPVTDPLTGGLILLGMAALLTAIVKTREPILLFLPFALVLMMLAPALALANPIETLHNMRASGAMPFVFIIAGMPLAVFCCHIVGTLPNPIGSIVAVVIALGAISYANDYNSRMYFERYTDYFLRAAQPHSQAGDILRGFADSDGSYGNAFVLPSPHWLDTRAVGIEGGKTGWVNDPLAENIPTFLQRALSRSDDLRLDPDRDLLFFYSQANDAAPILLSEWFPLGKPLKHELELDSKSFYTYRVPALGKDALVDFLNDKA